MVPSVNMHIVRIYTDSLSCRDGCFWDTHWAHPLAAVDACVIDCLSCLAVCSKSSSLWMNHTRSRFTFAMLYVWVMFKLTIMPDCVYFLPNLWNSSIFYIVCRLAGSMWMHGTSSVVCSLCFVGHTHTYYVLYSFFRLTLTSLKNKVACFTKHTDRSRAGVLPSQANFGTPTLAEASAHLTLDNYHSRCNLWPQCHPEWQMKKEHRREVLITVRLGLLIWVTSTQRCFRLSVFLCFLLAVETEMAWVFRLQ